MSVIHTIAYSGPKGILTKCGQLVPKTEARAFRPTCPECQDRSRWPTEEQRIAADMGRKP